MNDVLATNFTILVDAEIQNISQISKQLQNLGKNTKIQLDVDSNGLKEATANIEDMGLTFQQANAIMSTSIDIISSMVDQVFEMNDALIEFQKVSDLAGTSLDSYVDKLTQMGDEVARTGKPLCLSQNVRMVNVH